MARHPAPARRRCRETCRQSPALSTAGRGAGHPVRAHREAAGSRCCSHAQTWGVGTLPGCNRARPLASPPPAPPHVRRRQVRPRRRASTGHSKCTSRARCSCLPPARPTPPTRGTPAAEPAECPRTLGTAALQGEHRDWTWPVRPPPWGCPPPRPPQQFPPSIPLTAPGSRKELPNRAVGEPSSGLRRPPVPPSDGIFSQFSRII